MLPVYSLRRLRAGRIPFAAIAGLILLLGLSTATASAAAAQDISFEQLFSARECVTLYVHDGWIYGGLSDGGIFSWRQDDPEITRRWTTVEGMTTNNVTDIYWSGEYLWVASGVGLTRISDPSGAVPEFRHFANLGGLDISCVAGLSSGDGEKVYYGMSDGLGEINSGLPGTVFTGESYPGLVDDRITDLVVLDEDLWIGTQDGITRYSGFVFADLSAGLPNRYIRCLYDAGGQLLAGTNGGVAAWDPAAETWSRLGDLTGWVDSVALVGGNIWALIAGDGVADRLWRWDGSTWTSITLIEPLSRAIAGGAELLISGQHSSVPDNRRSGAIFLDRGDGVDWTSWISDDLRFTPVGAVSFAADGTPWLAARTGEGIAGLTDSGWDQIYEVLSAENDSIGVYNTGAYFFDAVGMPEGDIWFTQFSAGVLRFRPDLPDMDHVTPANSGLTSNRILRLLRHPDGPLLLLGDTDGADVLIDPQRWEDAGQWVRLPTGSPGLGGGNLRAAAVGPRDLVWFTVKDVGLVLWDVNGSAGPDAPLTWADTSDDIWTPPLTNISGSTFSFPSAVAVAVTDDGSAWVGGGSGVVRISVVDYGPDVFSAEIEETYPGKVNVFWDGLLSGSVSDLELDGNGDLWVSTELGLDRIRRRQGVVYIDPFTSLEDYLDRELGTLFSTAAISGLPGGPAYRVAVDPSGYRLLAGTAGGALLADIPVDTSSGDILDGVYLYPNPLFPEADSAGLKVGGLPPQGESVVTIFDLAGQPVFKRTGVTGESDIWDGRNRLGEFVSTGPYLVRVEFEGRTAVLTLAVVLGDRNGGEAQ